MESSAKRRAGTNTRLLLIVLAGLAGLGVALWPRALPWQSERSGAGVARFTDDTGRTITVNQPVRRVVSLAPNLTEIVFAIGLEERLVGVTDYCNYPPQAASLESVGGPENPNIERIAKLRPDLVLATRSGGNRLPTVSSLETLGFSVFTSDPHSVEEMIRSAERIGELMGEPNAGSELAASLRSRVQDVASRLSDVPARRVLMVVWPEPLITIGRDTFIADALRIAGAQNVIELEQDWPNVSLEEVARQQPEYLIFASDHSRQTERQIAELRGRAGWRNLEAVREERVIVLGEIVARPAPRLVDAIEQLARVLHPASFADAPPAPVLRAPHRQAEGAR
jgi:iron complex transport system substrate-binding protein